MHIDDDNDNSLTMQQVPDRFVPEPKQRINMCIYADGSRSLKRREMQAVPALSKGCHETGSGI